MVALVLELEARPFVAVAVAEPECRGEILGVAAGGGFFPWRGWGEFVSATARPGNGGPLRAPQGQTSVFYKCGRPPLSEVCSWRAE